MVQNRILVHIEFYIIVSPFLSRVKSDSIIRTGDYRVIEFVLYTFSGKTKWILYSPSAVVCTAAAATLPAPMISANHRVVFMRGLFRAALMQLIGVLDEPN